MTGRRRPPLVPSNEDLIAACENGTYVDEAQEDPRATEWNAETGRWQIPTNPLGLELDGGRVLLNGRQIGQIEYPYEEAGRRTRRKGFKVIMAGTHIGTRPTIAEARADALAWTPTDGIGQELVARALRAAG